MSRSLNNLCEGLVNGSNPRYIGSQPTIEEQVAWQLKKEEEARQALYKESARRDEERRSQSQSVSTYTPTYLPSYSEPTSFSTTYSTPSYSTSSTSTSCPSHLSHLSNLSGLSHSQPISYSTPSYSTSSSTYPTYPSFNCTNYGRVI